MVAIDSQDSRHSARKPDVQILSTGSGIKVLIGLIPSQKVERRSACFNGFSNGMDEQQHTRGKSTEITVVTRGVKRDDTAVVEAINGRNIILRYG